MRFSIKAVEVEDREEFKHHFFGPTYYSFLCQLYNELRAKVKYSNEQGSWEDAYQLLISLLIEDNIELP
jgi:hypothetical protein